MNLDKLFKHLADEHGLLLLESEKREIADCLPANMESENIKHCINPLDSVCGYCGRLLGKDNYPDPVIQGLDFEITEDYQKVEGSCCIVKERLGSF